MRRRPAPGCKAQGERIIPVAVSRPAIATPHFSRGSAVMLCFLREFGAIRHGSRLFIARCAAKFELILAIVLR